MLVSDGRLGTFTFEVILMGISISSKSRKDFAKQKYSYVYHINDIRKTKEALGKHKVLGFQHQDH